MQDDRVCCRSSYDYARASGLPSQAEGDVSCVVGSAHLETQVSLQRPSKKLSNKNFGPFEIIAKPGSLSFTLRLPDTMKSVHPVFHMSQLETSLQSSIPNRVQPPPPPIEVDREVEYKVEEILDSKINRRRRHCQLLYLVHWAGYAGTDEEMSWLLATELDHALELVKDFHHKYPGKPGLHKSA